MDDTNAVEDDGQMSERMLLEKRAVLVDAVETNGTLCRRNVDKTTLTKKYQHQLIHIKVDVPHNANNALRIPEQLVYIIVTNGVIVIMLSSHELAINGLIVLITNKAIRWLDNRAEVESFWDGIDAVWQSGERQ